MDNAGEQLDTLVMQQADHLIATTQALLRIDTVPTAPDGPDAPLGRGLRRALSLFLETAAALGLATRDLDGYAGHVEHGRGDEIVGVVSHLDVVPPGPEWRLPPFGAAQQDGALYARGAIDDKGPAMATLWALQAVRASGLPLRRRVRLIVGIDEELGGAYLERYFAREPRPALGFTPDGVFPLVTVEKGILTLTLHAWPEEAPPEERAAQIVSVQGGELAATVPAQAECVLTCAGDAGALADRVSAFGRARGGRVEAAPEGARCVRVWTTGLAAPGGRPGAGHNAIGELALALDALDLTGGRVGVLVRTLARHVGTDHDGAGLGLAALDGDGAGDDLAVNLGTISGGDDGGQATLMVCYPPSCTAERIVARLRAALEGSGVALGAIREVDLPPHVIAPDSELARRLRAVYRATVGGDDTPRTIAGATYARIAGNVAAFGPLLPGRPQTAHSAHEHIRLDDLLLLARIYARAIYALAQ